MPLSNPAVLLEYRLEILHRTLLRARRAAPKPKRYGINELLTPSGSGARKRRCRATVQISQSAWLAIPPAFREINPPNRDEISATSA